MLLTVPISCMDHPISSSRHSERNISRGVWNGTECIFSFFKSFGLGVLSFINLTWMIIKFIVESGMNLSSLCNFVRTKKIMVRSNINRGISLKGWEGN